MRTAAISALLAFAATSASALQITYPNITGVSGNVSLDLSAPVTITWILDSNQDVKTITKLELVVPPAPGSTDNLTPVSSTVLASNVDASLLKYTVTPPVGLTVNQTYQFWFYGQYNTSTTGIIAESAFFKASKISTSSATTSGAGSAPSGTGSGTSAPSSSTTGKKNGAGALSAFAGAGVISACAMLFL